MPFFVTALPDATTGEQVAIVIETNAVATQEIEQLKQTILTLAKYERPKTLLLIENFERTDNGKIKRRETMARRVNVIRTLV